MKNSARPLSLPHLPAIARRFLLPAEMVLLLANSGARATELAPEPARSSDLLVERIGVATHWGFHNTIYGTKWDELQKLLGDLGVRNVRDSLDPRLEDLWKAYGIRAILVTEPRLPLGTQVDLWKTNKHLIAAIEGPNEVNGGWVKAGLTYQGKSWPEGPHLFQDDFYKAIKADADLKDVPVLALSTAYKGAGVSLAPLRSFDCANAHCYAGGGMPSLSLDFRDSYLLLGRGAVCPPLAATESGYHTCTGGNTKVVAGAQFGVSHAAQRKYLPRQVAEYFNAGLQWTVLYEFGVGRPKKAEQEDPEAAFGLLQPDGIPKPAYHALKDLIKALTESHWDAAVQTWIRAGSSPARALTFALEGAPETVHHTLLQRADGSFQLLLWNEVPSFDLKARRDLTPPAAKVHLVLKETAESIAILHLGPDAAPAQQFQSVKELDVQVPDEVIVLNIKLAAPLHPPTLAAPAPIEAKTTPTSVELTLPLAQNVDAYWVTLNERNMGQARRGSDGKAHLLVPALIPATTYPFEVVAATVDGGVSAPAKIAATTSDAFPDLVVSSLKVIPESPKEGDTVTFAAVVENRGQAATEPGVLIGTKFSVDGKTICWNDQLRGPLAPGQHAEVKPNSGPSGVTSWVLTHGCHNITAFVDDVNRIVESNETNNRLTIGLTTGSGPDLLVKEMKIVQAESGKPLVADVTVANEGSEATPAGVGIAANLYSMDEKSPKQLGYNIGRTVIAPGGALTLTVTCEVSLEAGKHKLRVVVDDVHRVPQLNKVSHQADFDIVVAPGR